MRKGRQWISTIIALFILLSGMCLECFKADMFSFGANKEENTFINIYKPTMSVEARAEELNRGGSTTSIRRMSGQVQQVRRTLRVIYNYLCNVDSNELSNNFYVTEENLSFFEQDFGAVITNYIHNTDGKKRI